MCRLYVIEIPMGPSSWCVISCVARATEGPVWRWAERGEYFIMGWRWGREGCRGGRRSWAEGGERGREGNGGGEGGEWGREGMGDMRREGEEKSGILYIIIEGLRARVV